MPSGAKKRKAAKRRKEQEHQRQLDAHPPDSPTSPSAGPPYPPEEGNGVREEEDDLISQEGKGTESGGEFPSPTPRGGDNCSLQVEIDEEQVKSMVDHEGEAKVQQENDTAVAVDPSIVMESTANGGVEQPAESTVVPQKAEDVVTNSVDVLEMPVSIDEAQKDETPSPSSSSVEVQKDDSLYPSPSSDPVPPASGEIPVSKDGGMNVEVQSETCEKVDLSGDTHLPDEHKQSDADDTANPGDISAVVIEEAIPFSTVSIDNVEVVETVAQSQSYAIQEKAIVLSEGADERPDPGVESHPHVEAREISGTTGVLQSTQLQQRTSWLSCCGIFSAITGTNP